MWLVSKAPPSTVAGSSLVISNCLSGDDKLDNILEKLGRLEVSGFLKTYKILIHQKVLWPRNSSFALCIEKGYCAISIPFIHSNTVL